MVLTMAKLGDDLAGVASFHGNLNIVPANKDLLKAKILVCHGADDTYVTPAEVAQFKKQMDSIGASYTFKSYPGAVHAFTNPNATAMHQKFPDLIFIGSVPLFAYIIAGVATLLMLYFSDKIYRWDVRLMYGRVFDKLEETITEMEKLKHES